MSRPAISRSGPAPQRSPGAPSHPIAGVPPGFWGGSNPHPDQGLPGGGQNGGTPVPEDVYTPAPIPEEIASLHVVSVQQSGRRWAGPPRATCRANLTFANYRGWRPRDAPLVIPYRPRKHQAARLGKAVDLHLRPSPRRQDRRLRQPSENRAAYLNGRYGRCRATADVGSSFEQAKDLCPELPEAIQRSRSTACASWRASSPSFSPTTARSSSSLTAACQPGHERMRGKCTFDGIVLDEYPLLQKTVFLDRGAPVPRRLPGMGRLFVSWDKQRRRPFLQRALRLREPWTTNAGTCS